MDLVILDMNTEVKRVLFIILLILLCFISLWPEF